MWASMGQGFMGVGAGIRTKKGKFVGMTLERVHGRNVNKVICNERFNDVTYIFDMLYGVFTALDRAQSALGALLPEAYPPLSGCSCVYSRACF